MKREKQQLSKPLPKIPQRLKLDQLRIQAIEKAIANGIPQKNAATIAGISEAGLYYYRDLAEKIEVAIQENEALIEDLDDNGRLLLELLESIKRGHSKFIEKNMLLIQVAAAEHWQAAAWLLERRHPKEFGKTDKIEHSGVDGTGLTPSVIILPSNGRERK